MTDNLIYRTIPEQVAARLRQEILSGELEAGQPLREQALSERFGVSRGPIREVFRLLTEQGLLIKEPNKGVRVAFQPTDNVRPLIIELRQKIEIFVLDQIFDQLTAENIAVLDTILEDIKIACQEDDHLALVEHDIRFHRKLIQFHPNPDLFILWQPIMLRMLIQYTRLGDLMESYREHLRIVDAIRNKDKEAAKNALAANIL